MAGSILVAAAVIERNGRYLVARRPPGAHLAGLWEFPGGKCEPDETLEECLARELAEELGVMAGVGADLIVTEHVYPERTVRLHFRRCDIVGEPQPRLGQELRWVTPSELETLELPEADRPLVALLQSQRPPGGA